MRALVAIVVLLAAVAGLVLLTGPGPAEPAQGEALEAAGGAEPALLEAQAAARLPENLAQGAAGRSALEQATAPLGSAAQPARPKAAAGIQLRLVDSRERPWAGGRATLYPRDEHDFEDGAWFVGDRPAKEPLVSAEAGASGRVSLTGLAPESALRLVVEADGAARQILQVAPLLPGERRVLGDVMLGPGARVFGTVRDQDGRPVAGAKVALSESAAGSNFGMGPEAAGETTADASGRYEIDGLALGTYQATATQPGYLSAREMIDLGPQSQERNVDLRLDMGGQVSGQVTGPDGSPTPEAMVALIPAEGFAAMSWSADRVLESGLPVDQDGAFRIRGLGQPGKQRLAAVAPGYGMSRSKPLAPGANVVLRLQPLARLSGRVVDAAGRPAGLAELALEPLEEPSSGMHMFGDRRATADDQGAFTFDDLKAGDYRLTVSSAAGNAKLEGISVSADAAPEPLVVEVQGEGALLVRLLDAAGAPLAGAKVSVKKLGPQSGVRQELDTAGGRIRILGDHEPRRRAVTDVRGEARFLGLPAGSWEIESHPEGYARMNQDLVRTEEALQEVELRMERDAILRVSVVDTTGQPVPRTSVELTKLHESGAEPVRRVSDNWGHVVFTGLAPGSYSFREVGGAESRFFVQFEDDGSSPDAAAEPAGQVVDISPGEVLEEQLVLLSKAIAKVLVTRFSQPLPNATVRLAKEGASELNLMFGSNDGESVSATSDADGWAELPPCASGAYVLSAQSGPQSPATKKDVDLVPGQQELEIALASGVVRGMVMSADGPLAGARVHLAAGGEEGGGNAIGAVMIMSNSLDGAEGPAVETMEFLEGQTTTNTDSGGRFRFVDVPQGTWRLRVEAPGFSRHDSEDFDHDGSSDVDTGVIELVRAGSLRGRVTGLRDAGELEGLQVMNMLELQREDGERAQVAPVYGQGGYLFRDITPGLYKLSVRDMGGRSGDAQVSELIEVRAGETTDFDFHLD